MEGDLKTFLGLAILNQNSQIIRKWISGWFWGDKLWSKSIKFHDLLYSNTVQYDTWNKMELKD